MAVPLSQLYLCTLSTSIYLTMWGIAQHRLCSYGTGQSNLAHYHLVTLLMVISKLMKDVVNNATGRLFFTNYLCNNAHICYHQGHIAPDLITDSVQICIKVLNFRGDVTFTSRQHLTKLPLVMSPGKTEALGHQGLNISILESNPTQRKMALCMAGQPSQPQDITAGVYGPSIFCFLLRCKDV